MKGCYVSFQGQQSDAFVFVKQCKWAMQFFETFLSVLLFRFLCFLALED